ncbi:MAG: Bicarbonate transporter BicA [bacterium ADurb.Bin374]|nr:MAG: Bicarbonate transporter BicA [bacterium ADurb.Bin374]
MNARASLETARQTPSLAGDVWGGLAAMLVALPSSIAFGVLVYSGLGTAHVAQGAMTGILGAAAVGIMAPLVGRNGALISAPCAPAAAVLSAVIAELLSGGNGHRLAPELIPAILGLIVLGAGLLQIFYGMAGCGRLIKFIPYPVVTGYLSGVGLLIIIGQLSKILGLPKETTLFDGLLSPGLWKWPGLAVGIAAMAVMILAPRLTRTIPAPVLGLGAGVLTYFSLAFFDPSLLQLDGNALIIGPIQASGSFFEAASMRAGSLVSIDAGLLRLTFVPALTLSILLSIDTLKTCVVLDALTRSRHDSDRELIGQGTGNLAAFLAGGMAGAGTMGPTLVNLTSGGQTWRSAVFEGIAVVLSLLLLAKLIAWVPIGALAGILLVVAWRMIDKSIFHLLATPAGRQDFAVISAVVITALTVDLIAASGVGIALSILLFIRDQIRGNVIRRKMYLNETSSKTRRPAQERELLREHGSQGIFCQLQGNLFFGTTDQLYSQLEPDLRSKRFLLLDMRHVLSMDYTAAHLLQMMQSQLEERDGRLLFSGMPSGLHDQRNFEAYLEQLGVIQQTGGIMVFETRNDALVWIESQLLEGCGVVRPTEESPLKVGEFDLFREFDDASLAGLAACMQETSVPPGTRIFAKGDAGDELYLVRRGRISVLLPLEGGKSHHLADIGRGSYVGELSFLDRRPRSADAIAREATDLFVLSRKRFDELVHSSTLVGVKVFARLALVIAERLRQTDVELESLEER